MKIVNSGFNIEDIGGGITSLTGDGERIRLTDIFGGKLLVDVAGIPNLIEALQSAQRLINGDFIAPATPREIAYLIDCDGDKWLPRANGTYDSPECRLYGWGRERIVQYHGPVTEVYK